jgi:tetratricopeptide (TPR) repeat protein
MDSGFHDRLLSAVRDHQSGRIEDAIGQYHALLRYDPHNIDLLCNLAIAHKQKNELPVAFGVAKQAVESHPTSTRALSVLAGVHVRQGQLSEARELLRRAHQLSPSDLNVAIALANLEVDLGSNEGVELLRRYKREFGASDNLCCELGNCYFKLADYRHALAEYAAALENSPRMRLAHINRLAAAAKLGDLHLLKTVTGQATAAFPTDAEVLEQCLVANEEAGALEEALSIVDRAPPETRVEGRLLATKGRILLRLKRYDAARATLQQARINGSSELQTLLNLGTSHMELGRNSEALRNYKEALESCPDHHEALNNVGVIYKKLGRYSEAIHHFSRSLQSSEDFEPAMKNLAHSFHMIGRYAEAEALIDRLIAKHPKNLANYWFRAVCGFKPLRSKRGHIQDDRVFLSFEAQLTKITELSAEADSDDLANSIASHLPFYLAYLNRNNLHALCKYGDLCVELLSQWRKRSGISFEEQSFHDTVGVVISTLTKNSVWEAITCGLVTELPRNGVDVTLYYSHDSSEQVAVPPGVRIRKFSDDLLITKVKELISDANKVLIYPELGMTTGPIQLAGQRLSPVQMASWGHPETSGLSTIDYFISAEVFESTDSTQHYREQLICLPGIGTYYDPQYVRGEEVSLETFGLDPKKPIVLNPGTPFKYDTNFDDLLVRLASNCHDLQLVFFRHTVASGLSDTLFERLKERLTALPKDRCRLLLLDWLSPEKFHGLLRQATVVLDTIHFSGFNTMGQALLNDAPVVTLEGRYLRGRLGSGILRHIGLDELVCQTEDEYIALAEKLLRDVEYNQTIRKKISDRKQLLLQNSEPYSELARWIRQRAFTNVTANQTEKG